MSNRIKLYRTDVGYEIRQYKELYDAGQLNAENVPCDLILYVEEISNKDSNDIEWPNKIFMRGKREYQGRPGTNWSMRFGYFTYLIVTFENGKILFSPPLDSYSVQKEFAEKIKSELQVAEEYVDIDSIVF